MANNLPLLGLGVLAAAVALAWLPAFSGDSMGTGWTATREIVATEIEAVALASGCSLAFAHALVCNAYAESRLDPSAYVSDDTDGYDSAGLYQLHSSPNALGYGMSISARQSVTTSTETMIAEAVRVGIGVTGSDLRALVELVCRKVEKPANIDQKVAERLAIARALYPSEA